MQTQIKHVDCSWNWLDSLFCQGLFCQLSISQTLAGVRGTPDTESLWQPLHVGARASRAAKLVLIHPAANAESPGWQILSSRSPWSQAL